MARPGLEPGTPRFSGAESWWAEPGQFQEESGISRSPYTVRKVRHLRGVGRFLGQQIDSLARKDSAVAGRAPPSAAVDYRSLKSSSAASVIASEVTKVSSRSRSCLASHEGPRMRLSRRLSAPICSSWSRALFRSSQAPDAPARRTCAGDGCPERWSCVSLAAAGPSLRAATGLCEPRSAGESRPGLRRSPRRHRC
jgi:hypothetical protein